MRGSTPSPSALRRGFTLIELLTVIAIIGILAAILTPVIGQARASARTAKCSSNLRQIALAVETHAAEQRFYPPTSTGATAHTSYGLPASLSSWKTWRDFLAPYTAVANASRLTDTFYCAEAAAAWPVTDLTRSSYGVNPQVFLDINGRTTATHPLVRSTKMVRPGELVLIFDAGVGATGVAGTVMQHIPDIYDTNRANAAVPMAQGPDADNVANNNSYRFRHGGRGHFAFADGSVRLLRWDQLRRGNFQIAY